MKFSSLDDLNSNMIFGKVVDRKVVLSTDEFLIQAFFNATKYKTTLTICDASKPSPSIFLSNLMYEIVNFYSTFNGKIILNTMNNLLRKIENLEVEKQKFVEKYCKTEV